MRRNEESQKVYGNSGTAFLEQIFITRIQKELRMLKR
jgi:hypothetical protein